jgi:phage N-6-adenine-methyltransferase
VIDDALFSHKSDDWRTPGDLFCKLDTLYGPFTLDGAASDSRLVSRWLGPGSSIATDALTYAPVNEKVFLNPPYSMIKEFMEWIDKNRKSNTFVCLLPSRTDTKWWHRHVWSRLTDRPYPGVHIKFLEGRVKFSGSKSGAPFPSVIVVFKDATREII